MTTPHPSAAEFWARTRKTPDCWTWEGPLSAKGSGLAFHEGIREHAHRVAYRLTHGDIEDAKQVRRSCRNIRCVNPEHLYISKTPPLEVLQALHYGDRLTHAEIARRYGVDRSRVSRLLSRAYTERLETGGM